MNKYNFEGEGSSVNVVSQVIDCNNQSKQVRWKRKAEHVYFILPHAANRGNSELKRQPFS
jgi:hypothetical protein